MASKKKKKAPAKSAGASKKTDAKKKKVSRPRLSHELTKIFVGLVALIAFCLSMAMVADIYLKPGNAPRTPPSPSAPKTPKVAQVIPPKKVPHVSPNKSTPAVAEIKKPMRGLKVKSEDIVYEVFTELEGNRSHTPPPRAPASDDRPRIAVIIDDIGYDKKIAMALGAVDSKITFAVLPGSPHGKALARYLKARGAELMLHLPMEPVQYPRVNPGPGALLSSMSPDVLLAQLKANLEQIPGVVGVNNHMGSKLTQSADQMNQIFSILKKHQLFFIDSRTSVDSQCRPSARLLQIPYAERDIFLDNVQEVGKVRIQLKKLIALARQHGSAIGIGHPYGATLEALKIELPKIKRKIRLVPVSQLVHIVQ